MKLLIDMQAAQGMSAKGGIGRYAYNLLEAMIKNNKSHDISILLNARLPLDIYDRLCTLLPTQDIHIFEAFVDTAQRVKENHFRSEASKLTKEFVVSMINPDLFLIMSFVEGFFDGVITSMEGIFPTQRTVTILYDLIPLVQKEIYLQEPKIKNHYMQKISNLKECELLLSISEFSKNEAIEMLQIDKNNIVNISSGVDEKFSPVKVSQKSKDRLYKKYSIKNKFLMYTSSFDVRKNQKNLILAFALLDYEIRKDYQLLFIGNGSTSAIDKLKVIINETGLNQDDVIFLGYINDEDLLNLYNLASLFVFPSLSEGFGLPALEAMNCSVPTIGSHNTSIIEVIDNKDAFFDPTDVKSIAAKIQQVLEDESFSNDLKLKGIEQAKKFSWDITAIKALYALEKRYKTLKPKYANQYSNFIQKISDIKGIKEVSDKELICLSNYMHLNMQKHNKKIGIITTWNTRCGIASYARYLSQSFINKSLILAPKVDKADLIAPDESNILRVWKIAHDDLKQLLDYIFNAKLETIFIQQWNKSTYYSSLHSRFSQKQSKKT